MLSRLFHRYSNFRTIALIALNPPLLPSISPSSPLPNLGSSNPNLGSLLGYSSRTFSSDRKDNGGEKVGSQSRSFSLENDDANAVFGLEEGDMAGISDETIAASASGRSSVKKVEDEGWETAEGYKPWSFEDEANGEVEKVFDVGNVEMEGLSISGDEVEEPETRVEDKELEREEQELTIKMKGPNRAFGDLTAASGITEAMLDSLLALKDLEGIDGLPPLSEIEDIRFAKSESKSSMAEIERKKQEEIAKTYVRQVDDKGRAYGTGRRKCSIARVWIQPGDGKFLINDKQFDVYFPSLDNRADLLRPFVETKTLGLWDVTCTVKGGGVSGQVGAIRLGISRALQSWEPGLRPYLRSAGFLTRDPRVVERKKPGKAKARKSFQWVKR